MYFSQFLLILFNQKVITQLQHVQEERSREQYNRLVKHGSLSVEAQFEAWLNNGVPKEEDCFIQHIQPEGEEDYWRLGGRDFDRHREYSAEEIADNLRDMREDECITQEQFEKYLLKMMEMNFGSCAFDW